MYFPRVSWDFVSKPHLDIANPYTLQQEQGWQALQGLLQKAKPALSQIPWVRNVELGAGGPTESERTRDVVSVNITVSNNRLVGWGYDSVVAELKQFLVTIGDDGLMFRVLPEGNVWPKFAINNSQMPARPYLGTDAREAARFLGEALVQRLKAGGMLSVTGTNAAPTLTAEVYSPADEKIAEDFLADFAPNVKKVVIRRSPSSRPVLQLGGPISVFG